jgi:regulator of RNase E activity RraB
VYRKIVNRILSLSRKYGGKTGHLQQVEFFFYADSENKGSNLAIELSGFGYTVYGVERSENKWSIVGAFSLMKIDDDTLTQWREAKRVLADEMEVLFDGWGMLIEKEK